MNTHDPKHESLLEGVLVGDLLEDSTEIAELLAECSECRTRLEELKRLAVTLDAAAAEQRAVVEAAAGATDVPGLADVGRVLRERAGSPAEESAAPRPPIHLDAHRRNLRRPLVAAAVVLFFGAAVMMFDRMGGTPSEPDQILNSNGLVAEVPVGEVSELTEFRWEGELPAGETFTIQFFEPGSDPSSRPIKVVEWIRGPSWTPSASEIPWREFEWNVITTSETGAPVLRSKRTRVTLPATE